MDPKLHQQKLRDAAAEQVEFVRRTDARLDQFEAKIDRILGLLEQGKVPVARPARAG